MKKGYQIYLGFEVGLNATSEEQALKEAKIISKEVAKVLGEFNAISSNRDVYIKKY